jgi:cobalt-zinc-cadmium efflux system outer membrane protein
MSRLYWMTSVLLMVCCGCRTGATSKAGVAARPYPGRTVDDADDVSVRPLRESPEPDSGITLTAAMRVDPGIAERPVESAEMSLTLMQCISVGLAQNPDLIAVRQNENVGSAALGVAQTYPFNPFVQVQATPYQNSQLDDHGTTYHYVLLMQTIQLAHQQQFREEAATSTLNSTRWNIVQAELLNVAQTERLYFNVLFLRDVAGLAKANHQNNLQLLRVLEKQFEAGQANASDVAIVRTDARSTAQQARLAKANYETALRDLKRHLGHPADSPIVFHGDLRSFQWKKALMEAAGSAEPVASLPLESGTNASIAVTRAASRPDVMAAHSDMDAARAAQALATASKTPDLQIGPYYQRTADGMTYLGLRAQMDLMIVNSGKPLEEQRMAEFGQRATAWQQLQRRAELEAHAAWERYEFALGALEEDADYGESDLPTELRSLEEQFVAGEVDVVRVVQARTSIIQNQRARLDLLNEVAQSAANLTGATGISLEELCVSLPSP